MALHNLRGLDTHSFSLPAVKQFFIRRWFLMVLALVLALGISFWSHLQPLSKVTGIRYGIVAVVLFLMALPVEANAIWRAMRRPWVPLLAVAINFGLLPLVAWGVSFGLQSDWRTPFTERRGKTTSALQGEWHLTVLPMAESFEKVHSKISGFNRLPVMPVARWEPLRLSGIN